MEDFNSVIEQIQYTIKTFPEAENIEFKVDYCTSNSVRWQPARPRTNQVRKFVTIANEVAEKFGADAILVTIYRNNRREFSKAVKITNTHVPLFEAQDDEVASVKEPKENINGLGEVAALKHENEIFRLKMEQENTLRVYIGQINELKKENEELTNECALFAEDVENLQSELENLSQILKKKQSTQSDLIALGGIKILGKAFGMQDSDISDLSGIILSGGEDSEQLPDANKENGGGFELVEDDNINPERKAKQQSLITWMNSLDEEMFTRYYNFMAIVTNKAGAFDAAIDAVNKQIEPENNKPNNEEE